MFEIRTFGGPMSLAHSIPDEPPVVVALERDLRAWLADARASWDAAVVAADRDASIESTDLWNDMPALDSKVVARTSHIFKQHLGLALDPKLIRPGGYKDDDDMILDLIPKMRAAAAKRAESKSGDKK
jgi:hypothetical protein